MYHKVDPQHSVGLTIATSKLEAQLHYLSQQGYKSYHLSELQSLSQLPQKKNIVLTFDDTYVNQMEYAVPLLEKYQMKATFFIPLKYIGDKDRWNDTPESIMDVESLKNLPTGLIELAYHSYAHKKYNALSPSETEEDTREAFRVVSEKELKLHPSVAYPYGKFPRDAEGKKVFFQHLEDNGFQFGLRIGNRVNSFPFSDPFEINRIDVKGEWSLAKFKRRLRYGKWF
ncbi:polysaccharide deacetylase family protein [Aureisphaera galaxeae]|uniref:polysaccharide deacetylase family protein n=1 Tax=Aureisphaera galaxeae TaxID=1538023 RepID=UPI002350EC12|nr:polysaccharide deacetylase family protein [Aureisphaera galaxeae]MDC8003438.1 polysaccharide deacetylase family protein [Aureisphaera galaxeae]